MTPDPKPCPSTTSKFRYPQFWLALVLTCGEFALLYIVFVVGVPAGNEQIAYLLVGGYTAEWAGMLRFFSGTTLSSATKNEIIAKAHPVDLTK